MATADLTPAPVVVVQGAESLLVDRAVSRLIKQAQEVSPGVEITHTEVSDLRSGDLATLSSPSLFGDAPVVVITGIELLKADPGALQEAQDELLAYLSAPAEDARIILVHGGGVSGKAVLSAAKKTGAETISASGPSKPWEIESHRHDFVREEFKRGERSITPDAVKQLVEAVGFDLYRLSAACLQLMADVESTVGVDAVRVYYAGQAEVSWFDVAEDALSGETAQALAKVRALMDGGTDPVPVVAAVAGQLRRVARVAAAPRATSKSDLAAALGVRPGAIDKARNQSAGWSPQGLAAAITAVACADDAVKGGEVSREYALERMLVQIGRARSASR